MMRNMAGIYRRRRGKICILCVVTAFKLAFSSQVYAAQERRTVAEEEIAPLVAAPQSGRTADTIAGQIGQRQTRDAAAEAINTVPMARIGNRIPNRVQSRIRNRIDRDYDPRANATSPFVVTGERVRAATGPRRR